MSHFETRHWMLHWSAASRSSQLERSSEPVRTVAANQAVRFPAAFQEVRRAEAAASLRLLKTSEVVISSCIGTGKIADLIAGDSGESPSRSRKAAPPPRREASASAPFSVMGPHGQLSLQSGAAVARSTASVPRRR